MLRIPATWPTWALVRTQIRKSLWIILCSLNILTFGKTISHRSKIKSWIRGVSLHTHQSMRGCICDMHTDLRSILPPVQFQQCMPGVCNGLRPVPTPMSGGGFQPRLHLFHRRGEVVDPSDEAVVLRWVVPILDQSKIDVRFLSGHDLFYDMADILQWEC